MPAIEAAGTGLDVLVYNAGINIRKPLMLRMGQAMNVNVAGVFLRMIQGDHDLLTAS